MSFPSAPILDAFNRADVTPIDGNWANFDVGEVGNRIVSNQTAANTVNGTSDNSKSYYTASTYGPDTDVFATIAAVPANGKSISLWLRIVNPNTTSLGGYIFTYAPVAGVDTYNIAWTNNNVFQGALVSATGPELAAGNMIGFRALGTTLTGWVFQTSWKQVCSITHSTFTAAGYVGLEIKDINGTGRVDDFGGGTIIGAGRLTNYGPYASVPDGMSRSEVMN